MSFVVNAQSTATRGTSPRGELCEQNGQSQYFIRDVDRLPPFLMNVVSDSDWWLYVSSQGGLTAGRSTAENCLFPYETDDRLHHAASTAGPITLLHVGSEGGQFWQPFAPPPVCVANVTRSLSKNTLGNQVHFHELHHELELSFEYCWTAVGELGLVRKAQLTNHGASPCTIRALDGLRNIMPWGVPLGTYQSSSCLVDAYRRAELDHAANLGIYHLTAMISDRMYPAEALRANIVWACGLPENATIALDTHAVDLFRAHHRLPLDREFTGRKASYLVNSGPCTLEPGRSLTWYLVGDVGCDHVRVAEIRERLLRADNLPGALEEGIRSATGRLCHLVARADGLQHAADRSTSLHHCANTLFNVMRGGVVWADSEIPKQHFSAFLQHRNRDVASRAAAALEPLPDETSMAELAATACRTGDPDLRRLTDEFLPITFSRRHGDPSRPWNRFTVQVSREDGSPVLHYEGNWRDIFQNWEALCVSFPGYLEKIIAKFVNGSTVDGFNPYRVTSDGLEWEVPDPQDPWSNIGYWGDHQLIYLLKLLEALRDRWPDRLQDLLTEQRYVYFMVPYRLRRYADLKHNPRATIDFDHRLADELDDRVAALGEDGKLLTNDDQEIYYVTLWEKLLVPVLSKLSNFVMGGGIWMNTQRPEWNDANNALVGYGVSMVSLCYLQRYLTFVLSLLPSDDDVTVPVSREIVTWLRGIATALDDFRHMLDQDTCDDATRLALLDALGTAFDAYRAQVYAHGLSGSQPVAVRELRALLTSGSEFASHTIHMNRRPDELYHAYNLIDFRDQGAVLRHLYEMLEGQVAVLSAGVLSHEQAIDLLQAMYLSRLYCGDRHSFMLYPDRSWPDFLDRNVIPESPVKSNPLLLALIETEDRSLIARDALGTFRFQGDLSQAADVTAALNRLAAKDANWADLVERHGKEVEALFAEVFSHHAYTGRSGTMYGYEGLGCIYWHMVAKLLLAVQEYFWRAVDEGQDKDTISAFGDLYYRIRSGLGFEKTPVQFGAFPTDPYSHTPKHAGAQQPGMTGQVKEEILTRFGELGVRVHDGRVRFEPRLLRLGEFFPESQEFNYFEVGGAARCLTIPPQGLAFTYCQTPITYRLGDGDATLVVRLQDDQEEIISGCGLSAAHSHSILSRTGEVRSILVRLPSAAMLGS